MKNRILRFFCLVFAIVMCASLLVGCVNDDDGNDNGTGGKVTGKGEDRFADVDFNGKTIKISMPLQSSGAADVDTKFMVGSEGDTTDVIIEAVNNRNKDVCEKLNVKLNYSYENENWENILASIESMYKANNASTPDILVHRYGALVATMLKGMFMNCNTTEYTNYFDFEEDCWNADSMSAFSVGQPLKDGKQYILAGDYFIDQLRYAQVIFVNEDALLDVNQIGGDAQAFYEEVKAGNWTWDYLMNLSGSYAGYAVTNSDQKIGFLTYSGQTGYDIGAIGQPTSIAASADIDFYVKDGNTYKFNAETAVAKFSSFVDKIIALNTAKGTYKHEDRSGNTIHTQTVNIFTKGQTLFYLGSQLSTLESSLMASVHVSPLTFPKYTETDRYKTFVLDIASMGAVYDSTDSFTEVSAFLQLISMKSKETRNKYYEEGLKLKYETGENTAEMLDTIYDGITVDSTYICDFYSMCANTGENREALGAILTKCTKNNNNTFSSWWEGQREFRQQDFAAVLAKLSQLN